jgi:hypothetical protein
MSPLQGSFWARARAGTSPPARMGALVGLWPNVLRPGTALPEQPAMVDGTSEMLRSRCAPPAEPARGPRRPLLVLACALLCSAATLLTGFSVAPADAHEHAVSNSARHHHRSAHSRRRHKHRRRHGRRHESLNAVRAASTTAPGLVFGIYPGGAAGSVSPSGSLKPEDPTKRLAALEHLRPAGQPFVLHIYAGYTGPGGWSAEAQVGQDVAQYTAAGFQIELVLCYRPADGGSSADVAGFVGFVRDAVSAFGANDDFTDLQVTNEANIHGAPGASDGYYAGAEDALIQGVIAAKSTARADGFGQLKVGFNWAWSQDPGEDAFWSYLGRNGGAAFANSVDWVGLDAYPGTWGPSIGSDLDTGTAAALDSAFSTLRSRYLPLAGIPASTPLHVSESGYPTGPGRTDAMQANALTAAVDAVDRARITYNISDYRWFDLRDSNSSSSNFEGQYGLMTDDYTPKPAFAVYRSLVATLSVAH